MGNDGGFLPTRDCLAKEKPKEVKIDQQIKAKARAKLCQLTKQRLKKPIVMCRMGFLYNYQAIIDNLVEKSMPTEFNHIQKVKDVKEINISLCRDKDSEFIFNCPLTKIEFNGLNQFAALWTCGCVFSEKLLQNLEKSSLCPVCGQKYDKKSDYISLILEYDEQSRQIIKQQLVDKAEKEKQKKIKKNQNKNKSDAQPQQDEESKVISDKFEQNGEQINKKQKLNKNQDQSQSQNLIEKLTQNESSQIHKLTQGNKSDAYKKLFHKDIKSEDVGLFRDVRFGIR